VHSREQEVLCRIVFDKHLAIVGGGEDRLQSAGDIAAEQTDRAGRRNRDQMTFADAVCGDPILDVLWPPSNEGALQIFVAFEIGESCLFFRKRDRRAISRTTDAAHDFGRQRDRAIAAVGQAQQDEDVGKPGDAETDTPRAMRILGRFGKRKSRCVDDIVAQPHRDLRGVRKAFKIDAGCRDRRPGMAATGSHRRDSCQ